MHILAQLGQHAVSFDQVLLEAARVRRGKTNALDAFDLMHSFKKLNKRALTRLKRNLSSAVAIYDLAKKGNFARALGCKLLHFTDDILNWASAFTPAGHRDAAIRTVHVAALHNGYKGGYLTLIIEVISNGIL